MGATKIKEANKSGKQKPNQACDPSEPACKVSQQPKKPRIGVVLSIHPILFKKNEYPKEINQFKPVEEKLFKGDCCLLPDGLQEAVIAIQLVDIDNSKNKLVNTSASGAEVVIKTSNAAIGTLKHKPDGKQAAEIRIPVCDIKGNYKNCFFKISKAIGSTDISCTIEKPDASYDYVGSVTIPPKEKEKWSNNLKIQARELKIISKPKKVKVEGYDVMKLQWYLRRLGYYKNAITGDDANCDGDFSVACERAINRLQRRAIGPYRNKRDEKPDMTDKNDAKPGEFFTGTVNGEANKITIEEIIKWYNKNWEVPLGRLGIEKVLLDTEKKLRLRKDIVADYNKLREEIYDKGGILYDETRKKKKRKKKQKMKDGKPLFGKDGKPVMEDELDKNGRPILEDELKDGKPIYKLNSDGEKIYDGCSSLRTFEAEVRAGRSALSNHYCGIAIDLAQRFDNYLPVRKHDGKGPYKDDFWTVWAVSSKDPDPAKGIIHVEAEKKKEAEKEKEVDKKKYYHFSKGRPKNFGEDVSFPKGDYFNLTEVFKKHKFKPIKPHEDYLTKKDKKGNLTDQGQEWWHFEYELGRTAYFQDEVELVDAKYTEKFLKTYPFKNSKDKNATLDREPG
jgi:hypothetical protein